MSIALLALALPLVGPILPQQRTLVSAGTLPSRWDTAFHLPGGDRQPVRAFALFDDGTGEALYAGGDFFTLGKGAGPSIARWNGREWESVETPWRYGPWTASEVRDLLVHDGKLYVAGSFTSNPTQTSPLAVWDGVTWDFILGALDTLTFGSGGHVLHADAAGLYIGGLFDGIEGGSMRNVALFDGTQWNPLGAGTDEVVRAFAVSGADGAPQLYLGTGAGSGSPPPATLLRWDGTSLQPTGITDSVFSLSNLSIAGQDHLVLALGAQGLASYRGGVASTLGGVSGSIVETLVRAEQGQDVLYVAGSFPQVAGIPVNGVARWDTTGWSALGGGFGFIDPDASYSVQELFSVDRGAREELFAGGFFSKIEEKIGFDVARWDGSAWAPMGSGQGFWRGRIQAFALFDDGSGPAVHAGGRVYAAGGEEQRGVVRWDGARWESLPNNPYWEDPKDANVVSVTALGTFDDGSGEELFVAHQFGPAGVSRIQRFDGNDWSDAPGGPLVFGALSVDAFEAFDDGTGPALYAAGRFDASGAIPTANIARWDGAQWSAVGSGLGSGPNDRVRALAVFDDGTGPKLYAGGTFQGAGGVPLTNLAVWNGASWEDVGVNLGVVRDMVVADLPEFGGEVLVVCGGLDQAGGLSDLRGVAAWDGTSWYEARGNLPTNNALVLGLAAFPSVDGARRSELYLAHENQFLYRWDGVAWAAFTRTDVPVHRLASFAEEGPADGLWIGHSGRSVNGLRVPSVGVARWLVPRRPSLLSGPQRR